MIDGNILLTSYVTALAALVGALFGSFLDCAASRWAAGENWMTGRSRCVSCDKTLGARDLIPVVSFLAHRGRCRYCGDKIPAECLVAEIAGAVGFGLIGWHFGLSLELAEWLIFATVLLALSLTDLQKREIPHALLLVAIVNRLVWFFALEQPLESTLITIGFSAIVPVAMFVLALVFEKVRKVDQAMGGGDIKLLLVMALYLNWAQLVLTLVVGCVLGLVAAGGKMAKTIPFGPALAAGCILSATVLSPLATWYLSLF